MLPVVITAFADKSLHLRAEDAAGDRADQEGRSSSTRARPSRTPTRSARSRAPKLEEIAKIKIKDLTGADLDAAVRTIAGTARSMGVTVEGV